MARMDSNTVSIVNFVHVATSFHGCLLVYDECSVS